MFKVVILTIIPVLYRICLYIFLQILVKLRLMPYNQSILLIAGMYLDSSIEEYKCWKGNIMAQKKRYKVTLPSGDRKLNPIHQNRGVWR